VKNSNESAKTAIPLIIFTDLDGTLLDDSYSFSAALPALGEVRKAGLPCIICSSKTRAEIEHYRVKLDNHDPFISENGGGIFFPKSYFEFRILNAQWDNTDFEIPVREKRDYEVIILGTPYADLREAMGLLREKGWRVKGFGDMTTDEVMEVTGLSREEAVMSRERDFDEPFLFEGGDAEREGLVKTIEAMGLHYTQGQFYHILGNNDKGKAVSIVSALFRKAMGGHLVTAALGDSLNDLPMLKAVDRPVIVQKANGTYDGRLEGKGFARADGVGPEGWNRAVMELLREAGAQSAKRIAP
jgi:mannosyl-3-phosphoglycerate phosphatase family protein